MLKNQNFFDLRLERYRVAFHILFWIAFVVYEGPIWGMVDGEYCRRFVSSLIELPVKIGAAYFTLYVLIDKFFVRRKYGTFVLLLLLSIAGFGIVLRVVAYYIIYPLYYPDATAIPLFFPPKILIAIFYIYSLVGILASFHLIRHWYRNQQTAQELRQAKQQLEKEMLEAKLKFLKSQINPHFLFNTLNSLYVLALNRSEKTPEVIHKLSELMSYMLHEGNQQKVPLSREIKYIQNYIALEKIRYDARLDVSFNVYNAMDRVEIAPLVILPFVENCFKHGVGNQLSGGWIRIDILRQDSTLVIKVENSKEAPAHGGDAPNGRSGIGLKNVRNRLDLIYAGRYQLDIVDEQEAHLVVLRLYLEENEYTRTVPDNDNPVMHEMPDRRR